MRTGECRRTDVSPLPCGPERRLPAPLSTGARSPIAAAGCRKPLPPASGRARGPRSAARRTGPLRPIPRLPERPGYLDEWPGTENVTIDGGFHPARLMPPFSLCSLLPSFRPTLQRHFLNFPQNSMFIGSTKHKGGCILQSACPVREARASLSNRGCEPIAGSRRPLIRGFRGYRGDSPSPLNLLINIKL